MAENKSRQRKSKADSPQYRSQHRVQLISAVVLVVVGCGLAIAGFWAPPKGEIHGSVLILFGEILTFVGALFGVDYHYKAKELISHG